MHYPVKISTGIEVYVFFQSCLSLLFSSPHPIVFSELLENILNIHIGVYHMDIL